MEPEISYCVIKGPPIIPVLNQINPIDAPSPIFFLRDLFNIMLPSTIKSSNQCRREGSRYKLPGLGGPEVGSGLDYVQYVFVFLGSVRCN
jgi:hypothetical protein